MRSMGRSPEVKDENVTNLAGGQIFIQTSVGSNSSKLLKGKEETFVPPDVHGESGTFERAASKMQCARVEVPRFVSSSGAVDITYIHWPPVEGILNNTSLPRKKPILLIPGFDNSCLEFRHVGSRLAGFGFDTYAVDLLGWGFTQLDDINTFSAEAKIEALAGFWEKIGMNRDVSIVGSSLGGAVAVDLACRKNNPVENIVFINSQVFIDGNFMKNIPMLQTQLLVKLMKSPHLRQIVNKISVFDPERHATESALKAWTLQSMRNGWEEAQVSFMRSGGLSPSLKISRVKVPTYILWGSNDGILGTVFAKKLLNTLPNCLGLRWINKCGHFPHIEQPEKAASAIAEFLGSGKIQSKEPRDS